MTTGELQDSATTACCEPDTEQTPLTIDNRYGLSEIGYRIGTYAGFLEAMIRTVARDHRLLGWTARASDDYAVALLSMWAAVGEVLTFYQERIANEAYLPTAVQRASILRLIHPLGYAPARGMAAETYLALELEEGKRAEIPVGLRVQSVPEPGETPQKFETTETLAADARLNRVRIYPQPQPHDPLKRGSSSGILCSDAGLGPGDNLVVFDAGVVENKTVVSVEETAWGRELSWTPPVAASLTTSAELRKWAKKIRLFGYNAPEKFLAATPPAPKPTIQPIPPITPIQPLGPDLSLDNGSRGTEAKREETVTWEIKTYDYRDGVVTGTERSSLNLDAIYDDLKEGTDLLVVQDPPDARTDLLRYVKRLSILGVRQEAVAAELEGALSPIQATVTQVEVAAKLEPNRFDARYTTIYVLEGREGIALDTRSYADSLAKTKTVYSLLADLGIDEQDGGVAEQLASLLPKGRRLILSDGVQPAVLVVVDASSIDAKYGDLVRVTLQDELTAELSRESTYMLGNVLSASHGETVADEVLGSGDASTSLQQFELAKSPVTHVCDPTATRGAANSLEVRVGDVKWIEVSSLYGQAPDAPVYTTSVDDEGTMAIRFGDGVTGARPPTGRNNIVATYRHGLGTEGNVGAGSLKTLLDRPLGLKKAINPRSAEGGAVVESRDTMRANAPNGVRIFDRVVSLRDFSDAALAYSGIAKARATRERIGGQECVRLVVAGDGGTQVTPGARDALRDYLDARRDPNRGLAISAHHTVDIEIGGIVQACPEYDEEFVLSAANGALIEYFSFDRRELGQPVHLSDIYRALQQVQGVAAVRIDVLRLKRGPVARGSATRSFERKISRGVPVTVADLIAVGRVQFINEIPIQPIRIERPAIDIPGCISFTLSEDLVAQLASRPDHLVAAGAAQTLFWRLPIEGDELAVLDPLGLDLKPGEVGS